MSNLDFATLLDQNVSTHRKGDLAVAATRTNHFGDSVITPDMTVQDIQQAVPALDYEAQMRTIAHKGPIDSEGTAATVQSESYKMVIHSKTGQEFGPVGSTFKMTQPADMLGFSIDLANRIPGASVDSVGIHKGGAIIHTNVKLPGEFIIKDEGLNVPHLFGSTGVCGNSANVWGLSNTSVFCNNQFRAIMGALKWEYKISHRCEVNWGRMLREIENIPALIQQYAEAANTMANTRITGTQARGFFNAVYTTEAEQKRYNVPVNDDNREEIEQFRTTLDRRIDRMLEIYTQEATQQTESRQGTVWGLFNAVTFHADHASTVRGCTTEEEEQGRRMFNSMISGEGVKRKQSAWDHAQHIVLLADATH